MRNTFNNFSLRAKIIVLMIGTVLFSLIFIVSTDILNFVQTTNVLIQSSSKEINKQISLNFENYIDSVIETGNYIQEMTTDYAIADNMDELEVVFQSSVGIQDDIESITLLTEDGEVIVDSETVPLQDHITHKQWFIDAMENPEIYNFSSPHADSLHVYSFTEVITVSKKIVYFTENQSITAILVININTNNIVRLAETTNLGEGGNILLINDDDSLIYSSQAIDFEDSDSIDIIQSLIIGNTIVKIEGHNMFVSVNTLKNTRWRMATFINVDIIDTTLRNFIFISGVIGVVITLASIIISIVISNLISKPIDQLIKHMEKIQEGHFYSKIELSGQKEIVVLSERFNIMIEEIRELMDRLLTEQKEKRKTEFIALQTQINPHFLYNTLDSIMYLSENHLNDKVVLLVSALSKYFRISISKGKNIIPLKEELEHARSYLLIQKIRYNEKFDFTFETAAQLDDVETVKLILQPIIENAIYHGINTVEGQGHIIIRSYAKNDCVILEVEDNGFGLSEEKIQQMYDNMKVPDKQTSVGMRNIYQRLKLYYGDQADIIIISELDEKTIIRIMIPQERSTHEKNSIG